MVYFIDNVSLNTINDFIFMEMNINDRDDSGNYFIC